MSYAEAKAARWRVEECQRAFQGAEESERGAALASLMEALKEWSACKNLSLRDGRLATVWADKLMVDHPEHRTPELGECLFEIYRNFTCDVEAPESNERIVGVMAQWLEREPHFRTGGAGLEFAMACFNLTPELSDKERSLAAADRIEAMMAAYPETATAGVAYELCRTLVNAGYQGGEAEWRMQIADCVEAVLRAKPEFQTAEVAMERAIALLNSVISIRDYSRASEQAAKIDALFHERAEFASSEIAARSATAHAFLASICDDYELSLKHAEVVRAFLDRGEAFHLERIACDYAKCLGDASGEAPNAEECLTLAERIRAFAASKDCFDLPDVRVQEAIALYNATTTHDEGELSPVECLRVANRIQELYDRGGDFANAEMAYELAEALDNARPGQTSPEVLSQICSRLRPLVLEHQFDAMEESIASAWLRVLTAWVEHESDPFLILEVCLDAHEIASRRSLSDEDIQAELAELLTQGLVKTDHDGISEALAAVLPKGVGAWELEEDEGHEVFDLLSGFLATTEKPHAALRAALRELGRA